MDVNPITEIFTNPKYLRIFILIVTMFLLYIFGKFFGEEIAKLVYYLSH